jgi:DNA mismatch repair ATPase MutL
LIVSKSTQFGCDDIHELASILDMELHSGMKDIIQSKIAIKNDDMIEGISYHRHLSERSDQQNRVDRGEKKFIRLPKILSMFASRACRSSVMIGTALEHIQMNKIVSNLSLIEQPWNCPHGRPTMRHLIDLEAV